MNYCLSFPTTKGWFVCVKCWKTQVESRSAAFLNVKNDNNAQAEGGRLSWQQTCENSQLVRLPLMISLPISLKSRKGHCATTHRAAIHIFISRDLFTKKSFLTTCLVSSSSPRADNVYRKCLANGTWALKGNYSMCKAILHEEVRRLCACILINEAFHWEPSKHKT